MNPMIWVIATIGSIFTFIIAKDIGFKESLKFYAIYLVLVLALTLVTLE